MLEVNINAIDGHFTWHISRYYYASDQILKLNTVYTGMQEEWECRYCCRNSSGENRHKYQVHVFIL